MRRCFLTLAMILAAVILANCSEKAKNPVGFGLVEEEGPWRTSQEEIQELLADSCFAVTTGAGDGFYLLVGVWEEQETRSLLLFENLPDTLDLSLSGVSLTLTAYDEATEDSVFIALHALESSWDDSTVNWEQPWSQPGGDFAAEAIAQEYHALESGNQFELEFDSAGVDLVASWLSGGPNNGLLLRATDLGADNLKYFYSEDTPYNPILNFTFATSDTTDTTVTAIASHDAFIAQPGEPPEDAVLRVGDGIVYRTWLRFDLSAVPESVFVNRATLALTMMDFSSPLDRMTLAARRVTDMETLAFSSSLSGSASLYSAKELVEVDLTALVQSWIYGTENEGLILSPYLEYVDLSQALFWTSEADTTQRPTLTITYTARLGDTLTATTRGEMIP